ncbi:Phosphatidylinositol 3,4,5-trisphosphate 3-phosphatase and dual-specificity protein phosphatase PTEN [Erysiphe necator]|uniref:phosphatidylinositol-3,4,5-trisphosphate 3-phosphatase n=1 Tax=Uncinula necator TaxID=52586 RepID=A0A0B1P0D1_UNCNE|nr:Phosphatidylinositol 3,4,5-trisphosphate 3-phosphatase and dual-specificity protein phosphatase PTEN [Erysiphe necator]KHJ32107.1 putative phosphoinositide 3-phosphate phosphatase protein [Erysiphe necator]
MASLLRQIVAGPRARHTKADLDLCYVTPQIIATSGPSGSYPRRAYRNPLDQFVKFLDLNHGNDWAIWEFRAEGAGYPDEEVYGRVWHYPWPDHHPPPFNLVPVILTGIRKWLQDNPDGQEENKRVAVVHCKAGKGRSGTMVCSYLISECGWKQEEALARFTEKRMRPGFGQGVSIPSQLRWVGYVDRWARCNKVYVDRRIEILELNISGLRNGVKVRVRGFVEQGKKIEDFYTFTKKDFMVIENNELDIKRISKTKNQQSLETRFQSNVDGESSCNNVKFKPSSPIILPTSDVNIDFERRSKSSIGWKLVTSLAHVWFNCYFEGQGPEKNGQPHENGVFEIDWDKMDGIKGSSKKGAKAFDRLAVVWKVYHPVLQGDNQADELVLQPGSRSPVLQIAAPN